MSSNWPTFSSALSDLPLNPPSVCFISDIFIPNLGLVFHHNWGNTFLSALFAGQYVVSFVCSDWKCKLLLALHGLWGFHVCSFLLVFLPALTCFLTCTCLSVLSWRLRGNSADVQSFLFIFSSLLSMQLSPANSSQPDLSDFLTLYPQLRRNDRICLGLLLILWHANRLLPISWVNWGAHLVFPPSSQESVSYVACWPLSGNPCFNVLSGIWGSFKVGL